MIDVVWLRFGKKLWFFCRLTSRYTVEANSDGGGLHREAAWQAAQNRLNRVAVGFLAMEDHVLLHLHRFKLHTALCKRKSIIKFLMDLMHHYTLDLLWPNLVKLVNCVSHHWCPCSSQLAQPRNEHSWLPSWPNVHWVYGTPVWLPHQPFHRVHKSVPSSSPQL